MDKFSKIFILKKNLSKESRYARKTKQPPAGPRIKGFKIHVLDLSNSKCHNLSDETSWFFNENHDTPGSWLKNYFYESINKIPILTSCSGIMFQLGTFARMETDVLNNGWIHFLHVILVKLESLSCIFQKVIELNNLHSINFSHPREPSKLNRLKVQM